MRDLRGHMKTKTALIIGCGYLGRRVGTAWRLRGDDVWALTRSPQHATEFTSAGVRPVIGDVLDPPSLQQLPSADTILYAVGYDRSAAHSKRAVYVDGLRNVLSALPARVGRLIWISSTSVYGQSQGEWVDESSPCAPTSDGGRICLSAETLARESFAGTGGVSVLRLSGLYGPGRLAARIDALKSQRPVRGNAAGWINLIHVDDARDAILACAESTRPVETLLVTDDRPLQRRDYYQQLSAAIGAPRPVFDENADADELGKRCSNQKLREVLGIDLTYPTIVDGLPTAT